VGEDREGGGREAYRGGHVEMGRRGGCVSLPAEAEG